MKRKAKILNRSSAFARFAKVTANASGHPLSFAAAILLCLFWGVTGPLFGFSDTWQLVANTVTNIITFLMVFLIQNSQNRGSHAMQIKLDELIRATQGAHTAVIELEELTDAELSEVKTAYGELAEKGRKQLRAGAKDTGRPEVFFKTFSGRPE